MAGNRTLKLSILADVDNLKKGLNQADGDVSGFGKKIEGFAKTAGLAFAAAGAAALAYAGKLAVDGVKAAIEDEAAQKKLAVTLGNVTGATEKQIAATEDYITKTSLAFGVTDDQLRPSLDRLVRSTKDVEEAQKLQTLALDVAAGTGKDLQSVTEALAKAHDGNFTSLKRLGVSLDDSIIKSKNFDAATTELAKTFKDQASIQADTFQGKMDRLKIAFDEGKETIGAFILDAITPIVNTIVEKVVPAIEDFINGIGGTDGLKGVMQAWIDFAKNLFTPIVEGIKNVFDKIKKTVMDNKEEFQTLFNFLKDYVSPFIGGALKLAIEGLGTALDIVIKAIAKVISGFEKALTALKNFINFLKNNPVTNFFTGASFTNAFFEGGDANLTIGGGSSTSGASIGGGSSGFGKATPEQLARIEAARKRRLELEAETARIRAQIAARARGEIFGTTTNNINIGVAGDPEGVARTIINVLNDSYSRGTNGAAALY